MKSPRTLTHAQWKKKANLLEGELAEARETLRAIRAGEVDAIVVSGEQGARVFTLESADRPYRILVETMSEGAATLSEEGMITYANLRFAKILGVSIDSLLGTSMIPYFASSAASTADFASLFARGKLGLARATLSLRTRRGVFLPIYLSMNAVQIEGRPGVCVIAADMSERHHLEEARADVLKLNVEKDLRERFVSLLSHDLRNPLAAARLNSQMMSRYGGQSEKLVMYGTRVTRNIDRADQMIQNLLDANSIHAGETLPLDVETSDLRNVTRELLEDLVAIHGNRFVLEADEPIKGVWSPGQLRRVIENLALNAVKYGSLATPVSVALRSDSTHATISVHNQGSYLTPEERIRLFQPYARSSEAIASGKSGWGLGLTLVSGVVGAHGGSVTVESSPEDGTTFIVTLPRHRTASNNASHDG